MSKLKEAIKSFSPKGVTEGAINSTLNGVMGILDEVITNKEELAEIEVKIKEVALKEQEQANKLTEAYLADTQSARQMNIKAIDSDDKFVRRFIYYLAGLSILLTFTLLILLYFVEIPHGNERIVDMALGSFIGAVLTIFAFFYGSTQSSKDKNTMINKLVDAKKGS